MTIKEDKMKFKEELINLINKYSLENKSNTPDFLLAEYILNSLSNFEEISSKFNYIETCNINEPDAEQENRIYQH